MNKAAAKSMFTCKRDVDAFLGMYLTERQTHGAGASQPSASAHEPSEKTSQPQRLAPPAGAILSEHDGDEFNASLPSFGAGRVVPEDGDDAWYSRRDGRRVLARYMEADDAEWYQKKDDDKWWFKKGEDTWYMKKGDDTWHLHGAGASQPSVSALQPSAKTSRSWASNDSAGTPPARDAHGAGASHREASAPPLLATPRLALMSQDDLFANSRQALLSTDGGASQLANLNSPALDESSDGRWQMAEPMPTDTAVSPQATEGIVNAPTTDRSAGASDRWASAWVTRAIAAELSRLQPFGFEACTKKRTHETCRTKARGRTSSTSWSAAWQHRLARSWVPPTSSTRGSPQPAMRWKLRQPQ